MPYILQRATGDSIGELQHAINRHVNAIRNAHRPEPKVMVGRAGDGWTFSNLHLNGTTHTVTYATEKALRYALNRRLGRVRRIAGTLREAV